MDTANRKTLRAVPVAERKLVANHDAFGYFAAHSKQSAVSLAEPVLDSLSTSAQPSAQTAGLVKKIRAAHVKAIFTESSINPKLEEQIATSRSTRTCARSFGPAGSKGATYVEMEPTAIVSGSVPVSEELLSVSRT